jgi:glycolate oxidase FAD binding subunit
MDDQDPVLARLVDQVNSAREHETPLEIRGGATKRFYGGVPVGEPLDTTELAGITSYEPTELVVTARAGTRLSDLEAALAEQGQCLPFEPPRFAPGGTMGGMVAAGLSGPARASVGSVRDHVLGVTLLNGRSEVLTFGGQVTKNVAGYDVSRLMVGSLGILGIICEVSIKVLPASVATATLCFEWQETRALEQLKNWAAQPLPINASAWHAGRLHLRLAGARAAVAAACGRLGGERVKPPQANDWWTRVRDQRHEFFTLDDACLARGESLWRLSMPATSGALDLPGQQFIEWNGAQRWWRTAAGDAQVREAAARAGGHATLLRGDNKSHGVFAPLSDVLMRVHHGLKQAFDPKRIFNPGRLYVGL